MHLMGLEPTFSRLKVVCHTFRRKVRKLSEGFEPSTGCLQGICATVAPWQQVLSLLCTYYIIGAFDCQYFFFIFFIVKSGDGGWPSPPPFKPFYYLCHSVAVTLIYSLVSSYCDWLLSDLNFTVGIFLWWSFLPFTVYLLYHRVFTMPSLMKLRSFCVLT